MICTEAITHIQSHANIQIAYTDGSVSLQPPTRGHSVVLPGISNTLTKVYCARSLYSSC